MSRPASALTPAMRRVTTELRTSVRCSARSSRSPTSSCRWAGLARTCSATLECGRRRGHAVAGRRDHPGREVRLEHRVGIAGPVRRHAVETAAVAEERAAKTAVKIMIPLVLFIFPGVFVVLVGPAGIQIANTLMAK